jgi:hypothetical protein
VLHSKKTICEKKVVSGEVSKEDHCRFGIQVDEGSDEEKEGLSRTEVEEVEGFCCTMRTLQKP